MKTRELRCEKCGTPFSCERDNPEGCWCAKLPPVMPLETAMADCLCPDCLNREVELRAKKKEN